VPSGINPSQTRISGQTIIDQLLRNMELGKLEMAYSVLLPCVFSVYLHPDDYARIAPVADLLREDARRALTARMAEWNANKPLFRRGGNRKQYKTAQNDWWIEFFADTESAVPPGDVEIHSELNDTSQPGYRGAKTTLTDREPSITSARVARDRATTRKQPERIFAEIRYQDDSGAQTFLVAQNEISIGRGGEDVWVDLALYTSEEVSREHLRLRRDAAGAFTIVDKSRNGTWVNGKRIARDKEHALPDRAEIGVADAVKLIFEARR
jgi:hypothetical protein